MFPIKIHHFIPITQNPFSFCLEIVKKMGLNVRILNVRNVWFKQLIKKPKRINYY